MKKKFTFLMAALMLLATFAIPLWMWGQNSQTTGFNLSAGGTVPVAANANPATGTISGSNSETWNVTINGSFTSSSFQGTNGNKYWQMGKSNSSITSAVFSTNGVTGTITSIVVNCATAGGPGGSLSATVGGLAFGTQSQQMSAWSNNNGGSITFSGNASGEIVITEVPASGKACYIQSITVTYTTGGGTAHSINIGSMSNGSVESDKATATAGEAVNLTVTPNTNYALNSLTVVGDDTGDEVTVTNNQFTMPDEDVIVSATFVPAKIDVMNQTWTGVTGTTYSAWSGKAGSASDAVYAGNCAGGNSSIQLRTTNSNSGIVSTTSGGKVKKVSLTWNSNTPNGNKLDVYGKNTAYSSASDLYSSSSATKGTLIGSIVMGTSTELTITDNYSYIGLRSNSGAIYITEIDITWRPSNVATPIISVASGTYTEAQNVTITCTTPGSTIYYTLDGTEPTKTSTQYNGAISISETKTLKAVAYVGDDASIVASATYTIETPLSSIQEIFETATSSSQTVYITFGNWIVSGIEKSQTSVRAYVTDGTNGFVIYNNSGHGFSKGDIISGTAQCSLSKPAAGYAQITSITASDVSVAHGGTVTAANIPLSSLSGINVGALVSYNDLAYDGSVLSDGETSITPYSEIMSVSGKFTSGKNYNVTGVYFQVYTYSTSTTSKDICPREAADIVLKAQMTPPTFEAFSYVLSEGDGPSDVQSQDISGSDFNGDLTVTAPEHYEVSSTINPYNWGSTATYTPNNKEINGTLYVRLAANLSANTYNGDLTFEATNLDTKTVALEGTVSTTQTYDITLTQPAQATIKATPASAEYNATVTLSYTDVIDCYEFSSWSVMYEEDEEIIEITPDANNQFTMPAAEVLVSATFVEKTITVQYSVNGTVEDALEYADIDCGDEAYMWDADELEAEGITIPDGYTFAGWSKAPGSTTTVSSFAPTENSTLYAVIVPDDTYIYVRITSLENITAGEYFIVNDGYVLPSATTSSSPVKTDDYKIETPLRDSYNTLPVNGTLWTFTVNNSQMAIQNSSNAYLYCTGSATGLRVGNTSDTWTFEVNGNGFAMKEKNNSRFCATYGAGSDWRGYTIATASNYGDNGILYLYKKLPHPGYTCVEEITSTTATLPSIESTYLITVHDGGVLTVNGAGSGTAANLIIEDGGQLYTTSDGVQATVQKSIAAGVPESRTDAQNWYLISSSVNTPQITTGTNLITGTTTPNRYDLYRYNEANATWENYKAGHFTTLQNGRGYLYRNESAMTIEFSGTVNTSAEYTVSSDNNGGLDGFNLMGNPYTHNIKKGVDFPGENSTGVLATGFYKLNASGAWVAGTDNTTAIAPNEGFLVKATTGGKITFNTTSKSKNNSEYLQFTVANSEYEDVAYAWFDKGEGLNKINHRNADIPMIYINKEGQDYAIATMGDDTKAFNLNFKAMTTGKYTLSYKANGEFNYLHVIDRLTGEDVDMLLEGEYSFIGSPQDSDARFIVKLGYLPNYDDNGEDIFAYQNGNDIVVSGEGELQIFDVMGRMVSTMNVSGVETISGLNNGVYIFRMEGKTQKIVVR